jgi:hypothetical protein
MKRDFLRGFLFSFFAVLVVGCSENDYNNSSVEETPELESLVSTQFTNVLSEEEALNEVNSLLAAFAPVEMRASGGSSRKRTVANYYTLNAPDGVTTRSSGSETAESDAPLIYVVNLANEAGEEAGYVIVSGDKRVSPVLAVTDNGSLSKDDVIDNPGVILFLEGAEAYATNAGCVDPVDRQYTVYGAWTNSYLYGSVIAARWGQNRPYNNFCYTPDGKEAVTGCTATAVAQLLYHHGYPASYNGYTFNWNIIKSRTFYTDILQAGATDAARLMQQTGLPQNLDASYGTSAIGTGASFNNVSRTLEHFGYAKYGSVADYNQSTIQSSVGAAKPVLVAGYSTKTVIPKKILGITVKTTTSYSGGHAWVIDAVLEENVRYLHIDQQC